jgi:AcrR family transcriptional regulator
MFNSDLRMAETSRRLSPERRGRIVDAARHLILRQGLRATTMEAIAREAKIAKPTLYGYFPDKEAVFAAIVQALADDIRAAFGAALEGEGDVAARIGAALAAKYEVIGKLLAGSAHSDELYSEHDRSAAAQFAAIEKHVEEAVVDELGKTGIAEPETLARLVLASAYGVGRKATGLAEAGPAIRLLVERLVRPEMVS